MKVSQISLVLFTCEGREHLLHKAYNSFKEACDHPFKKTILAIDGKIRSSVIDYIQPDIIIQSPVRKGYINNIIQTLPLIDVDYFFWLEDDWKFNKSLDINWLLNTLKSNDNWVQIVYNKDPHLSEDQKKEFINNNLYKNINGFSANPCICKTSFIRDGFNNLLIEPKGDKLGEDGFENSLSRYFTQQNLACLIYNPIDYAIISHEGYLESTPRSWHMTNSLEQKPKNHLLTIPVPSFWRKLLMAFKLASVFSSLVFKQLVSNEVYEFCFRIISSVKSIKKHG